MFNDLPAQYRDHETVRQAYNAAFCELDLQWHWDDETYSQLVRRNERPEEQVRHYLEQHHSHLLRAYDAEFLIRAIQQKVMAMKKGP
jgi:hypothetical protein